LSASEVAEIYDKSFAGLNYCEVVEIEIESCEELQKIGNEEDYPSYANYYLTQNIDCSATNPTDPENSNSIWSDGKGFDPIGCFNGCGSRAINNPFTGTFDGQGFSINNLYINRNSENYVGLFGYSKGNIQNIDLIDFNVDGALLVAGLVGVNDGFVSNSYSKGSVIADSGYVGILVGNNQRTIEKSYSTGIASGGYYVGGLVGYQGASEAVIDNSYSSGKVSGNHDIGGLVGYNIDGDIINSYSSGEVIGSYDIGGLVGFGGGGICLNSFWDTQTSKQTTSDRGIGKTTADMKQRLTFTNWDFSNIWKINEGVSYPYLCWEVGCEDFESPTIEFVEPPTPEDGWMQKEREFSIETTASDVGRGDNFISSFIDFDNSLKGWWRMDDILVPGFVADISGNDNHGTLVGSIQTDGYLGKGMDFDGDDYIAIDDDDSLDVSKITISLWFKKGFEKDETEDNLISKATAELNSGYILSYLASKGLRWRIEASGSTNSINEVSLNDDKWHHIVAVYNGEELYTYLDGLMLDNKGYYSEGITPNNQPVFIGSSPHIEGENAEGIIDDVMIFDRALSEDEIVALYAGNSVQYPDAREKDISVLFDNLEDDSYNFKAYVQDTGGNVESTEQRTVIVDNTPPDISFADSTTNPLGDTPLNGATVIESSIPIEVDAEDELTDISTFIDFDNSLKGWWRLEAGCDAENGYCYACDKVFVEESSGWFFGGEDRCFSKLSFFGIGSDFDCDNNFEDDANGLCAVKNLDSKVYYCPSYIRNNNVAITINNMNSVCVCANGDCNTPYNQIFDFSHDFFTGENSVLDSSDYNHLSNIINNPVITKGYLGEGMSFETDDAINVLDLPQDIKNDNQGTISAWIKRDSSGQGISEGIFLHKKSDNTELFLFRINDDDELEVIFNNGATFATVNVIDNEKKIGTEWTHVAVSSDGNDYKLYVNGEASLIESAGTLGLWFNDFSDDTYFDFIGAGTFNGIIDDFMIFDRDLSDEEIGALYADSKDDYFTKLFDNLEDGDYNFRAYSQDRLGNFAETEERVVSVESAEPVPPEIVEIIPPEKGSVFLSEGTTKDVSFSFIVYDANKDYPDTGSIIASGYYENKDNTDYGYDTQRAFLGKNCWDDGSVLAAICGRPFDCRKYSCTAQMYYYDDPESWEIYVTGFKDLAGQDVLNPNFHEPDDVFSPNSITGIDVAPSSISFPEVHAGMTEGVSATNSMIIKNTGNVNLGGVSGSKVYFRGRDLTRHESSEVISSENFIVYLDDVSPLSCDNSETFITLQDKEDSPTGNPFNDLVLPHGDFSKGHAQDTLYYCMISIDEDLPIGDYSTGVEGTNDPWQITAGPVPVFILSIIKFIKFNLEFTILLSVVSVSVKKKKKSKKSKKNLGKKKSRLKLSDKEIFSLDNILLEKYNVNIKELLKEIEELEIKKVERKDVKKETEIKIPIEIFKLGSPAEMVCKYLKENIGLRFNVIADLINRDERTVWTNYHNSVKKIKKRIKVKREIGIDKGRFIFVELFSNRRLSILESVVYYLKKKEFRNSEIAKMLGKDQRNISTLLTRIKKKLRN